MVKNVLYVNKLKNIKNNENQHPGNPTKLLNYPLPPFELSETEPWDFHCNRSGKIPSFLNTKISLITVYWFDYEVILKNRYLLGVEIRIRSPNGLGVENNIIMIFMPSRGVFPKSSLEVIFR